MSGCTRYATDKPLSELLPVCFTENAAQKASKIFSEIGSEGLSSSNLNLRLSIKPGGCAGLEYQFDVDDNIRATDHIETTNGINLLIDKDSYPYLSGSTVDYLEDLEGERFTIDNPNAEKTCGCGSSFDAAIDTGK
jgi:iron-sulfur cluster insertion protein